MAVCNIFKQLTNRTGSFLMFSQYVEDLTKNHAKGYQYRVVPSRFIACDINYSVLGSDLNQAVPQFFQNNFENGCAAGRDQLDDWNPDYSKYIFWNALISAGLISKGGRMEEIMYRGVINLQSYDVKDGMGYSETYIHIPPQAGRQKYECTYKEPVNYLETTELTGRGEECVGTYYLDQSIDLGENTVEELYTDFHTNSIIVLYDVYSANELGMYKEEPDYVDIPMGVYFPGIFEDNEMTNIIHKFYSNPHVYGSGTSYSVRICTRMVANPEGDVINTSVEGMGDINLTEVLSKMSENLDKMMEISGNQIHAFDSYKFKQIMQQLQNSQTNVPYILDINGDPYWFVNGKNTGVRVPDGSKCLGEDNSEIEKMFEELDLVSTYIFDAYRSNRMGERTDINYDKRFKYPLYIAATAYDGGTGGEVLLRGITINGEEYAIGAYNELLMNTEGDYEIKGLVDGFEMEIPNPVRLSVRRMWPIIYGRCINNFIDDNIIQDIFNNVQDGDNDLNLELSYDVNSNGLQKKYSFYNYELNVLISDTIYNRIELHTGKLPPKEDNGPITKKDIADKELGNNIIYMYPKSLTEDINQIINMSNMDDIFGDFEMKECKFSCNGEIVEYILLRTKNVPYETFVSLEFNNEEKIIN